MTRAAAFIRNVMVGRNGLTRDVLLQAFAKSGAASPRSYLSTGNVSFEAADPLAPQLLAALEDQIEAILGRREPVLVRTIQHLGRLVRTDPFSDVDANGVHERCVTFMPTSRRWTSSLPLTSTRGDVELFAAIGSDVFSVTRLVKGRPGTAGPIVERETGHRVTTRNWKTIERIVRTPA